MDGTGSWRGEGVDRREKSYGNQKISGAESCVVEGYAAGREGRAAIRDQLVC